MKYDAPSEADWQKVKAPELKICTRPELQGVGSELLFIARKIK